MARISLFKKYPGLSALLVLEVLAFLVVSYQIQVDNRVSLLEKMALVLISPIQSVSHRAVSFFTGVTEDRKDAQTLSKENLKLTAKLQTLEAMRPELLELQRQNQALRDLLKLPPPLEWRQVVAEVIARTTRRGDYLLIINRGTRDGIRREMGVCSPKGVVGVVWEVSHNSAKIITINNPKSVVAALVRTSRFQESFISGKSRSTGRLENFPNYEPLLPGDEIVTSGLDGVFPKGLPIGKVLRAVPSAYAYQDVEVAFSTDFSRLEEVGILVPNPLEPVHVVE